MLDPGCERRALSVLLHSQGHADVAKEVLCADDQVAAAFARVGKSCIGRDPAVLPQPKPAATACYADPLVAKRANVPVCK